MPWKEPGDKPRESQPPREPSPPREPRAPRERGPWNRGQGNNSNGGPDFEAWVKSARRRLGPFGQGPLAVLAFFTLLLVIWFAATGWVAIGSQQVGVLLRLGRFQKILQPGLHWRLPAPIDRVVIVDRGRTRSVGDQARLLTRDGQLVEVDYEASYKITDARRFLFATRDTEDVIRNAAIAAARQATGAEAMPCLVAALANGCPATAIAPEQLAQTMTKILRAELASIHGGLGVQLSGVSVREVGVPADVKPAFADIDKAYADSKAAQATAQADATRTQAEAQAQAAASRVAAAAGARKQLADANAAVARFDALLDAYQAAPQVLRHRLWLDAMRDVLTRNRVVVNSGTGNVIVQFPLHPPTAANAAVAATGAVASPAVPASAVARPQTAGAQRGPAL